MKPAAAQQPVSLLEHIIKHRFSDDKMISEALTHSSSNAKNNYERLEFLGDRVLGLAIAESLYKKFPGESEGDLAKRLAALVQGELLAEIARTIQLGSFIVFSDAERGAGGADNKHIVADVFESVIGALYLDGGFEKCRRLIEELWSPYFDRMPDPPQHPKTYLQEWAQGRGLPLPSYKVAGQEGPDHAPLFQIALSVKDYPDILATGRSRQEAEKAAAALFIEKFHDKK